MASGQQTNGTIPPSNQIAAEKGKDAQAEEEKWDEQELEKAMSTLKELHIKVNKSTPLFETSLIRSSATESAHYNA